jgi:hypothetical protein
MGIEYTTYLQATVEALADDKSFNRFRSNRKYMWVVETVNDDNGELCLNYIKENYPLVYSHLKKFKSNDYVGGPEIFHYADHNISLNPTTCRYIKVLGDLIELFGSLDGLNIIEIGSGYGGQCKVIHELFTPKSYTIVDLDQVLELNKKYLGSFGKTFIPRSIEDKAEIKYDLCISNYAFSEFDRPYQTLYAEKIIKNSTNGYMILNFIGQRLEPHMTEAEIYALHEGKTFPEYPPSGANILYTWGSNNELAAG